MKKLNKFVLKSLALLFAFSIAVSCGESKSNQKVLFDKIILVYLIIKNIIYRKPTNTPAAFIFLFL